VAELVALCEATTLPANIALFGAWGSGKSSLANLLEGEFATDRHKDVAFARFDAFKYAGASLHRHLLSQIAKAFEIKDDKYSVGLYSSTKTNKYHIPLQKLRAFGKLVALVTAGVILFLVVVAAVVAAIAAAGPKGSFSTSFSSALENGVPAIIIGSGLFSALVALAGQTFTVESTQAAPSTEEEFDRLFRELVGDIVERKKCGRIVIFIDELDRCSPGQVVTVLETIRTFLDISPCVFVVAADQQAIERALTESARQSTPRDSLNPYYSAGSAYLDKIFQHQLALPPLLSRTLSQFALNLIADRPGIWQEITNKAELVTVLVPSHVRSPRRVKVLLNGFVLAYRLARRRASDGALDPGVAERASEVAKLVCLRTEFPLFAADLRLDARMPRAVLALAQNHDLAISDLGFTGFSDDAFARARAFASGQLPTDEVITQPSGAREDISDSDDGDASEMDTNEGPLEAGPDVLNIVKSQARQLIAYLQRTQRIAGPARDLVFLESSGAAVGLNAELADRLEQDARNGATDVVIRAVANLEPSEQEAALHLLCHLARDALGIEAENIYHCLLETVQASEAELALVVDDVLTTLQASTTGYQLDAGDLPGAFEISLLRTSEPALALRGQVLAREETTTDEGLGLLILSHGRQLDATESGLIGPVLTARLCGSDVEPLFEAIADLDDRVVETLLSEQEETIHAELQPAEGEDVADGEDAVTRIAALAEYATAHRAALAPVLLRLLLGLGSKAARSAAEPLLGHIAPITDGALVRAVLVAAVPRFSSLWAHWLEPLAPAAVSELEDAPSLIAALTPRLVTSRFAEENTTTDDDTTRAIGLLARIRPQGITIPGDEFEAAFQAQAAAVVSNDHVDLRLVLHRIAHELAEDELLPINVASRLTLADASASLGQPITLDAGTERLPSYVLAAVNLAMGMATVTDAESTITAATNSPWLEESYKNLVVLYGRAVQRGHGEDIAGPLTEDQLAALMVVGPNAVPALVAWVRAYKPPADLVRRVFGPFSSQQDLDPGLQEGIRALVAEWDGDTKRQSFSIATSEFVRGEVGSSFVQAAQSDEIEPGLIAGQLSDLFDNAANNVERERLMQLWRLVRPEASTARRTLIDRVYIPLLRQGKGAAKIALDHFDLVRTPPSTATKDRIRAAISDGVRDDDALKRRANELLRDAGWTRRRRLFR